MIIRAGIFVVGLAVGASVVLFLDNSTNSTYATDYSAPEPGSDATERSLTKDEVAGERSSSVTGKRDRESVDGSKANAPEFARITVGTPSLYRELVGSIPRARPNLSQVHADFKTEQRDEPWAAAMESGIRNYFSGRGKSDGLILEYLECRSRHCVGAGITASSNKDTTGRVVSDTFKVVGDMAKAGWWQADGGMSLIRSSPDGVDRFIVFVGRYGSE